MKAIIFDMDGVLLESRDMHWKTLNDAIGLVSPGHTIPYDEHLRIFNGLPTKEKLKILSDSRGLDESLHDRIFELKQEATHVWIRTNVVPNDELTNLFKTMKSAGFQLAVASNSIWRTTKAFLDCSDLSRFVDLTTTNQDVKRPKPSPEMYLMTMAKLNVSPQETLIVEDSPVGCTAALASGAQVLRIGNPGELNVSLISKALTMKRTGVNYLVPNLNIVIPMAGEGSRFKNAGFKLPKPLIDVDHKPMINVVTDSLNLDANYTFLVRRQHLEEYPVYTILNLIKPASKIVEVKTLTEGAACTILLAKHIVDNDQPLMIVNSDQFVDWDYAKFMQKLELMNADAGILTFKASESKWSYALTNEETGFVTKVAEKVCISEDATCGVYYWRRGSDFCHYAQQMIDKNVRVNGEFYVCPVFNEAIADGKKVITFEAKIMKGLGTPEDLEVYINDSHFTSR